MQMALRWHSEGTQMARELRHQRSGVHCISNLGGNLGAAQSSSRSGSEVAQLSVAIRGNQRPSVAIRGNQAPA